jgi:hypothetical protein
MAARHGSQLPQEGTDGTKPWYRTIRRFARILCEPSRARSAQTILLDPYALRCSSRDRVAHRPAAVRASDNLAHRLAGKGPTNNVHVTSGESFPLLRLLSFTTGPAGVLAGCRGGFRPWRAAGSEPLTTLTAAPHACASVKIVTLTEWRRRQRSAVKATVPLFFPSIFSECIEPLGLTLTAAAAALGVTRTTLSELVNGRRGISPEIHSFLSRFLPRIAAQTVIQIARVVGFREWLRPGPKLTSMA